MRAWRDKGVNISEIMPLLSFVACFSRRHSSRCIPPCQSWAPNLLGGVVFDDKRGKRLFRGQAGLPPPLWLAMTVVFNDGSLFLAENAIFSTRSRTGNVPAVSAIVSAWASSCVLASIRGDEWRQCLVQ